MPFTRLARLIFSMLHRKRQLEEVKILEALARNPNPHVIQFHEAWEEKEQLHIRTTLAECGDLACYLTSVGETGGLDEGRCWKLLYELTSVSYASARLTRYVSLIDRLAYRG